MQSPSGGLSEEHKDATYVAIIPEGRAALTVLPLTPSASAGAAVTRTQTPRMALACPPLPRSPHWLPMFYLVFEEGLNSKLETVGNPFTILPDIEDEQAAQGDHAGAHGQPEGGHTHVDLGCWGRRGL